MTDLEARYLSPRSCSLLTRQCSNEVSVFQQGTCSPIRTISFHILLSVFRHRNEKANIKEKYLVTNLQKKKKIEGLFRVKPYGSSI